MKIMGIEGRVTALAATIAILQWCNVAQAQQTSGADDKAYSGAICVPGLGTSFSDVDIRATFIKNVAGGYRWIACSVPIDADEVWSLANNNGGTDSGIAYVDVALKYGGYAGTTKCTAQLVNSSTGGIVETAAATVDGNPGGVYRLSLPGLTTGSADNHALGINCLLQAGVKLHVINIEEYAATHQDTVY